mmetsp:Transcript_35885/g.114081  ORF Transcript_35885/g.114081 Transcript_35885/m.114081 type:complete len:215 (-) Transcript_35885:449-1093(-)
MRLLLILADATFCAAVAMRAEPFTSPLLARFTSVAANLDRSCCATFSMPLAASMARLACCVVRYLRPIGSTTSRHSRPFLPLRKLSVRHPGGKTSGSSLDRSLEAPSFPLLPLTPKSRALLSPSLSTLSSSPARRWRMARSTALARNSARASTYSCERRASCRRASSSAVLALRLSCSAASAALLARCSSTMAQAKGSRRQAASLPAPLSCRGV